MDGRSPRWCAAPRALAVSSLCAAAAAQGLLVLPDSHAAREGTTATSVPFGRSTPVRVQCVYDRLLFAAPVSIDAIAFRLDGGAVAAGKQVECEIRMSTAPLPLTGTSALFAANRGADEVVVLPRQLVSLPGQNQAAVPSAFLPAIPLAVPFAYDPAGGGLVVEIVVHAQPPGSYTLDATYVCDSPEVAVGPPACQPAAGLPLRVESATTQVLWGRPWLARVRDAPPGVFVALVLGTRSSGSFHGFVLPQDLAGLGAPGCHLSIDIAASWFGTALGDGSATFSVPIPNDPRAVSAWVHFQAGAIVPGANALGVVTSQAKRVQVCGFEPVARVWATDPTATSGVREIGTAPVVQLGLQ